MLNSPVDIALLFGAALLLFGPKKLPEIGRALGQGIGNFKRSLSDAQEEVKSAIKEAEKPANANAVSASNPADSPQGEPAKPQEAVAAQAEPPKTSL